MEHRRQRPRTRSLRKKAKAESSVATLSLSHLAELIDDGEITIGMQQFGTCIATAADADCTYALLVRRRGESFLELLARLDQAVDKALTVGIFTDEINP